MSYSSLSRTGLGSGKGRGSITMYGRKNGKTESRKKGGREEGKEGREAG